MKLAGKSLQDLLALRQKIEQDPANRNPGGGLYLYAAPARKKLDEIDRAITQCLRDAKLARGETIDDAGYSGRQTNRR